MKLMTDRNWFAYEIKKQTKQNILSAAGPNWSSQRDEEKKIQKRKSFRTSKDNNYIT